MTPSTESQRKKPRLALAIATSLGIGYIPKAPGTFGSLVGVGIVASLIALGSRIIVFVDSGSVPGLRNQPNLLTVFLVFQLLGLIGVAALGIWSASVVVQYTAVKDPQYVVIDEVSGQHLALLLALVPLTILSWRPLPDLTQYAVYFAMSLLNWKYLLAGFLLFRLFDIWKPFPIRRLEKLPGGWGIMADDWMAGIYAAICLRVALHFGLL